MCRGAQSEVVENLNYAQLIHCMVILVQEEQDPHNRGFTVGAQPAEALHVQQWDPGARLPGQAGEPGAAADAADGGEPGVEQPGLQLPPRFLSSLPFNPRPAGCHTWDEGQCQKVTLFITAAKMRKKVTFSSPANLAKRWRFFSANHAVAGGVKARMCLANHPQLEIQLWTNRGDIC